MVATVLEAPRNEGDARLETRLARNRLVPREKVEALLHEIAYVLHVTRKVKKSILDQAR